MGLPSDLVLEVLPDGSNTLFTTDEEIFIDSQPLTMNDEQNFEIVPIYPSNANPLTSSTSNSNNYVAESDCADNETYS